MKNTLAKLILLSTLVINSGCPKPCIQSNLSFIVNSQFNPDNDSIHVGDTIYLESSFSTQLIDQSTGRIIDYSNSKGIGSTLAVSSLPIGDSISKDAVFDFDYISVNGKIYNDRSIPRPDGVQQVSYEETNGDYILKVGLIAKKKGNYILGIGDGLSNGRKNSNNCEKASFNNTLSNTDQHFYLIKNWYPNVVIGGYGKLRVYYFKVY
ncbi:MAG: hypothetical protein ABI091_01910 [Ferruginibacter sp.]